MIDAHVRSREIRVNENGSVRLDKWLWAARFFKTRSLATDAVDRGKVKRQRRPAKPARNVRIGDVLDIDNGSDRGKST
jgi:ribosome-associated heat shock protein Hsp15